MYAADGWWPDDIDRLQELTGGVPLRVHELASEWARERAIRDVAAAADRSAAAQSRLAGLRAEIAQSVEGIQHVLEQRRANVAQRSHRRTGRQRRAASALPVQGAGGVRGGRRRRLLRAIRVFDVSSGADPLVLSGHESGSWDAEFIGDGDRLASVGQSGELRVWDVSTDGPAALGAIAPASGSPWSVDFSPDGNEVLVGTSGQTIERLSTETGERLAERDAQLVGRLPYWAPVSADGRFVASTNETDGTSCRARRANPRADRDAPGLHRPARASAPTAHCSPSMDVNCAFQG